MAVLCHDKTKSLYVLLILYLAINWDLLFYTNAFPSVHSDVMKTANGRGYFLVDPVLRTGHYDTKLPLDSIACQTVLSKLLGPLPQWDDRLRVSRESGYNMIHFTPLQVVNSVQFNLFIQTYTRNHYKYATV